MLSDVEWNVAVTVRDSALIESNTANRLITPNYNAPEVPIISFDIENDGGYIQINLTNPDPVGDRPNTTTNETQRPEFNATKPDPPYQGLGHPHPTDTYNN